MPVENHPPHPLLHEYVQSLWQAERDFQPPRDSFEILPDSYIELIFSFSAACQLDDGETQRALPPGYIIGLLRKPLRLRARGRVTIVAARFFAWGFLPLIDSAAGQPSPPPVRQLDATLQQISGQLEQHVAGGNLDAALAHLHAFLIAQALQAQCTPREIQAATQILLAERGSARIADVAERCYVSRRQLERAFNRTVGVSPKALARQMRFERARPAVAGAADQPGRVGLRVRLC